MDDHHLSKHHKIEKKKNLGVTVSFWANFHHLPTKKLLLLLIQRTFVKKKSAKVIKFQGKHF
jgi:hypothetical protein